MEKLIIVRNFDASAEKVWKAFTTPEILKKWWAPEGMTCPHATLELKKGGVFHFCFKGEDGNEFWGRGVYQTIEEPELISYIDTFADEAGNAVAPSHYGMPGEEIQESLVEFEFSSDGKETAMTTTMDNHYDDSMTKEMINGWNEMFDKLGQIL